MTNYVTVPVRLERAVYLSVDDLVWQGQPIILSITGHFILDVESKHAAENIFQKCENSFAK